MKQLSIFLIDTNDFFSIMLDNALGTQIGYRLSHYHDGEKAVKDMYLMPDVVVIGDSFDDDEKTEIVSKIKACGSKAEIIVISKPDNDILSVTKLFNTGVYDYIIKDKDILKNLSNSILNIRTVNTGIRKDGLFRKMGWV